MSRMGLSGHAWRIYLVNAAANATVAAIGYLLFGGLAALRPTLRSGRGQSPDEPGAGAGSSPTPNSLRSAHVVTLGLIGALIVAVVGFKLHVGMGAFCVAIS